MDYIPSETLRGHLDTIILLSLVDCDKHTNQIKDFIEERSGGQFVLKQGTFYSCLQRISKQGFVTEYRTTDEDGVRRKFFQLTEKGKTYIDDNKDNWAISKQVLDMLISPDKHTRTESAQPAPAPTVADKAESDPIKFVATGVESSDKDYYEEDPLKDFLSYRIDDDPNDELNNRDLSYIDFTQAETVFSPVGRSAAKRTSSDYDYEQLSIDAEHTKPAEHKSVVEKPLNKEGSVPTEPIKSVPKPVSEEKIVEPTHVEPKEKTVYDLPDNAETEKSFDYKSVLDKIFGSQSGSSAKSSPREIKYEDGVNVDEFFSDDASKKSKDAAHAEIKRSDNKRDSAERAPRSAIKKDDIVREKSPVSESRPFYDFTDIQDLAAEEGFKIRISSRDNKKDIGKILVNKLNFHNSVFFFIMIFVETMILALLTRNVAELSLSPYLVFSAAIALLPLVNGIIYFIDPSRKTRTLPTFKNSIELILIICLNLLLIDVVCCVLGAVDFSSYKELTRYIFYPILFILDLPVYVIIRYLALQKNKYYE